MDKKYSFILLIIFTILTLSSCNSSNNIASTNTIQKKIIKNKPIIKPTIKVISKVKKVRKIRKPIIVTTTRAS